MINKKIVLACRPQGIVKLTDMALHTAPVAVLQDGELLIQSRFLSIDPAIRYWLNEGMTYIRGVEIGESVRCFAAGEVIATRHAEFKIGDQVTGVLGAQMYAVSDGAGPVRCDRAHGR